MRHVTVVSADIWLTDAELRPLALHSATNLQFPSSDSSLFPNYVLWSVLLYSRLRLQFVSYPWSSYLSLSHFFLFPMPSSSILCPLPFLSSPSILCPLSCLSVGHSSLATTISFLSCMLYNLSSVLPSTFLRPSVPISGHESWWGLHQLCMTQSWDWWPKPALWIELKQQGCIQMPCKAGYGATING